MNSALFCDLVAMTSLSYVHLSKRLVHITSVQCTLNFTSSLKFRIGDKYCMYMYAKECILCNHCFHYSQNKSGIAVDQIDVKNQLRFAYISNVT